LHLVPQLPRASRGKSCNPGLRQTSNKDTGQCPLKTGSSQDRQTTMAPNDNCIPQGELPPPLSGSAPSRGPLRSALKGYKKYGPVAPPTSLCHCLAPLRLRTASGAILWRAHPRGWKASEVADYPEFSINPLHHTICAAWTPLHSGLYQKHSGLYQNLKTLGALPHFENTRGSTKNTKLGTGP
jgi:hypothetical protein